MKLDDLESAVLTKLLQGEHPVLVALRAQLPHLSAKNREHTGAGFYTEFVVGDDPPRPSVAAARLVFGDVEGRIAGLEYGAGFLLYVEDGLMQMLEGFSYEEPWPGEVSEFSLRYSDPTRKGVIAKLDEHCVSGS